MMRVLLPVCFILFQTISAQEKIPGLNVTQYEKPYSKFDLFPVVILPQKWEIEQPLSEIDGIITTGGSLNSIKPEMIESVKVEKGNFNFKGDDYNGKIIIKTKPQAKPKLITISELVLKYTSLKKDDIYIYSIDGEIINADQNLSLVDESNIMQIKVSRLDKTNNLENLYYIKMLTRSDENLQKANELK